MTQPGKPADAAADRRRYFRIDDEVVLRYRVIDAGDLPKLIARFEEQIPDWFTLTASLAAISQEMKPVYNRIRNASPDVARYLHALDRKLDIMGRVMLLKQEEVPEHPTDNVNLSAGGIAFHAQQDVPKEAMVEIRMILYPSFTGILCFGTVVYCRHLPEESPEYPYRIAVDFRHMREQDRELLIKHVLSKESTLLRRVRDAHDGVDID